MADGRARGDRVNAVSYSAAYVRGYAAGLRACGYSLLRRLLVSLVVTAILWGVSIALLWEAADVFFRLTSGETARVKVVGIWEGYWRVRPRHN